MLKKFFVGTGCGVWGVGCRVLPIREIFCRKPYLTSSPTANP
ncbi:hypothetical protein BFG60_4490 [Microcystis aeruginosa NIES-98]|uniref:Uncharacterized protein n=1 Tax=Microcystis aeruginosa PCC 7806SL TaxID=1903187 RepID=A0AB33BYF9_MICA7|nr:hypothetical protein BH695_2491 [Microcystis aeruginosa PCC 7806SL]ELS47436.1 hypothetical protein C789_2777 [Microcystis aeruginosa FACHB-905 = DIANCHI905]ODV36049.1 hypothetical protein BFG60_4490 [Microcystis aeruginosa NIES-98]